MSEHDGDIPGDPPDTDDAPTLYEVDPTLSDAGPEGSDHFTVPPVPSVVGHYRIVRKLGEGAMGVVYEAEQSNPQRRVALKIVRGGQFVDETRLRLFQREIATLARLKHPNIGAIYESGCTEDGQHFFAMELVRGQTLDVFLRTRAEGFDRPGLEQRLALFRKIADAVHYAHQRGVIHRDLKPTNVIVDPGTAGEADVGDVKVLDFGLARITDGDMAAATLVTEIGTIRGTLGYMSPEQTQGNPEEIDVRTDVYSLGVILYEMLTGSRPYDTTQIGLVDAVRMICEDPPISLRQYWSGPRRPDSDLETVVYKALEKDVERRYASAAALSDDIGRYLASQPILARPPSATYQVRMLVRRHKVPFALSVLLGVLLLVFGVGMSVMFARAVSAEAEAKREAQTAERALEFIIDMFQTSDPSKARGDTITAREILDQGAEKIETELEGQPEVQARLLQKVAWVYRGLGLYEAAEPLMKRSLALRREVLGPDDPLTLDSMNDLAVLYLDTGQLDEAERLREEVIARQSRVLGVDHADTLKSKVNLAVLHTRMGHLELAERLYEEVLEKQREVLEEGSEDTLRTMNNLATLYTEQGRYELAEPLHLEALEGRRLELGEDHPDTLNSRLNLAVLYEKQGRLAEAERAYRLAVGEHRRVLPGHPHTLVALYNLASMYLGQGRPDRAEPLLLEAYEGQCDLLGETHADSLDTLYNLVCARALLGNTERALDDLERLIDQGYTYRGNPEGILSDPDLESLRGSPRFERIAETIRRGTG